MPRRYLRGRRGASKPTRRYKQLGRLTVFQRRRARLGASSLSRPVHYYQRATPFQSVVLTNNVAGSDGVGYVGAGYAFRLNEVHTPSDFTNLYDQYKIISVRCHFKWTRTGLADPLLSNPPVCHYFTDHDDASVPNHDTMLERSAMRQFAMKPDRVYTIPVRPALLQEVYRTAVTTSYVPKWGQFVDLGTADVPHYGLKIGWAYQPSTAYGAIVAWFTYTFACKGVR